MFPDIITIKGNAVPYSFDEEHYLQLKLAQLESVCAVDKKGKAYDKAAFLAVLWENGLTLQRHYELFGRAEGLNPNPYFNECEYVAARARQLNSLGEKDADGAVFTAASVRKSIVAEGLIPVEHYERVGAYATDALGCYVNPSNAFDANAYFAANLLRIWGTNERVNGRVGMDVSMSDLVEAMAASGASPVTHYATRGAAAAVEAGMPLLQTVPLPQRAPNDPKRQALRDLVPANYNAATPAPANVFIPFPPPKPADVGGLVPAEISPLPIPPARPVPTPDEPGYTPPPPGWADTPSRPMVPVPEAASVASRDVGKNMYWVSVDADEAGGIVVAADGAVVASLPPGSVRVAADGAVFFAEEAAAAFPAIAFAVTMASPEAEVAEFVAGKVDVFVTRFGSEGVCEEQTVDFSGVTLEAERELVVENRGAVARVCNDTGAALSGEELAEFAARVAPKGWTASSNGALLTYAAETFGDKETIKVGYMEGASPSPFLATTAGPEHIRLEVVEEARGGAGGYAPLVVVETVQGRDETLSASSLICLDSVDGFAWTEDRIALPSVVERLVKGGEPLVDIGQDDFAAVVGQGEGQVGANEAGLFKHGGDYFLLINDANAEFSAVADVVVRLVGLDDADAVAMTLEIFVMD